MATIEERKMATTERTVVVINDRTMARTERTMVAMEEETKSEKIVAAIEERSVATIEG